MARTAACDAATRSAVKYAFETGCSNREVVGKFNLRLRTVERMRATWRSTGVPFIASKATGGPAHTITQCHMLCLLAYLEERPQALLDEMAWYLFDTFDLLVSVNTISRELREAGWTRKAQHHRAAQRDPELRMDWLLHRVPQWRADQLVFVDESASSERNADRKYSWSPIGYPSINVRELKRHKRWSILPALDINGYFAYEVIQASFTMELFNDFIRTKVLPHCGRHDLNEARSVLVMDNAPIHRNEELKEMCNEAGVLLEYLPPYSPDFNPIELSFGVLKSWIRRHQQQAVLFAEDEDTGFGVFLEVAIEAQNGRLDYRGMFKSCGVAIN